MTTKRPFRFGVVSATAASAQDWIAKVRRFETMGFSTVLMPDRLVGPLLSPLPALATAAVATTSLRVGTFVLASGLRNPVVLARELATLDFLSGGRLEVGLGAGVGEVDFSHASLSFGTPGERVERLAETLRVVKALLGGEKVGDAEVAPRPAKRPPILVAAGGKRLVTLAAREADVVGLGVTPREGEDGLARRVAWVREAASENTPELAFNLVAA